MSMSMSMSEAIFSPVDRPLSEIQVVAFPYAGAGIAAFSGWAERFPENFDFSIVCYPGREKRFNEKALDNMADLIEDLSFSFQDNQSKPIVFFGHSMGALVAFELGCYLKRKRNFSISGLIVSSMPSPGNKLHKTSYSTLNDDQFIQKLKDLGGTPAEIFSHTELLQVLLPTIRSDFSVLEHYQYDGNKIHCPIEGYCGLSDKKTLSHFSSWQNCTQSRFNECLLEGDHFYINPSRDVVISKIIDFSKSCV